MRFGLRVLVYYIQALTYTAKQSLPLFKLTLNWDIPLLHSILIFHNIYLHITITIKYMHKRTINIALCVSIFVIFMLFGLRTAHAYVYVPDPSFDYDGFRMYHYNSSGDFAGDVIIQSDNKILVTGELTIVRFNANGALDPTFSGDGVVMFTDEDGFEGKQLALQDDGKILVVGTASYASDGDSPHATLLRYNTDGTLDTTFDSDGYATAPESLSMGEAVEVLDSGAIVIAGYSQRSSGFGFQMSIWEFTTAGALDTSFDTDGVTHFDEGDWTDAAAYDIAEQSDNKLVLAGYADAGAEGLTTWRYNSDGSIDTSFSTDGFDKTYGGYDFHFGMGIKVRPTGEIIVGGYVSSFNEPSLVVQQYDTNGDLDSAFGTGGQTMLTIPGDINSTGFDMELLSNGQLVFAGRAYEGFSLYPLLVRFTSTGDLDTQFYGTGYHWINDIDGETVVGGEFYGIDVVGGSTIVAAGDVDMGSVVDILVMKAGLGYQVTMPAGLHLNDSNGNSVEPGSEYGIAGTKMVIITDSAGHPIVEVEVNFSRDVTWSHIIALTDLNAHKSVTDALWMEEGITGPHALFVPKAPDDNYVYFCPYATSLTEVNANCQDGIRLTTADGVTIVTVGGQEYWKIEGTYSTGGFSAYYPELAPTGSSLLLPLLLGGACILPVAIKFRKFIK